MSQPLNLGHSGAEIELGERTVRKTGRAVSQQAAYIQAMGPGVGPAIYHMGEDRYVMERLRPYEPESVEAGCEAVLELLALGVWTRPAAIQQSFRLDVFQKWLEAQDGRRAEGLSGLFVELYAGAIPDEVLIHGDPTLANALRPRHPGVGLRLIDPLPPKDRVPSWADVDRGKVLQSLCGWEKAFGAEWPHDAVGPRLQGTMQSAHAWFWCAVHIKRILPYVIDDRVERWCEFNFTYAKERCTYLL